MGGRLLKRGLFNKCPLSAIPVSKEKQYDYKGGNSLKLEYLEKDEIWGNAPHRPDLVAELAQGKRGKLLVKTAQEAKARTLWYCFRTVSRA